MGVLGTNAAVIQSTATGAAPQDASCPGDLRDVFPLTFT